MRVLYHFPSMDSIYAYRTIFYGFKHAFEDLGHEFRALTADDNLNEVLSDYQPNLFMTASHFYYRKYLNLETLNAFRKDGLFVLAKIDFWTSPLTTTRLNEAPALKDDKEARAWIESGKFADAFYHVVDRADPRMEGFTKATGLTLNTIPLAADKSLVAAAHEEPRFQSDVAYVGSRVPEKEDFFKNYLFPLRRDYDLRVYGQDWNRLDWTLGWFQRAGQYFNFKPLSRLRKPKLKIGDEARIYKSATVSVNVHEEHQRKFGGDCNERTFKIPLCGGFEITDDVACIHKYFEVGKEIVVAPTPSDWVDLVQHYIRHPDERLPIIAAGRARVLRDHTYHNRVEQILNLPGVRAKVSS